MLNSVMFTDANSVSFPCITSYTRLF